MKMTIFSFGMNAQFYQVFELTNLTQIKIN